MESGTIIAKDVKSCFSLFGLEFIGTIIFSLVYAVKIGNSLFIGLGFLISYNVVGRLTGGYFNMATSVGVMINQILLGKFNMQLFIGFIVLFFGQLLGSYVGASIALRLWGPYPDSYIDVKYFSQTSHDGGAFFSEFLATFILIVLILNVKSKNFNWTKDRFLIGLAQSIAYIACIGIALNPSGGCLNPLVGLAINTIKDGVEKDANKHYPQIDSTSHMWIYVLGPLIAAPLAALFNYLVQYFLSNTSKNENPITEDLRED